MCCPRWCCRAASAACERLRKDQVAAASGPCASVPVFGPSTLSSILETNLCSALGRRVTASSCCSRREAGPRLPGGKRRASVRIARMADGNGGPHRSGSDPQATRACAEGVEAAVSLGATPQVEKARAKKQNISPGKFRSTAKRVILATGTQQHKVFLPARAILIAFVCL